MRISPIGGTNCGLQSWVCCLPTHRRRANCRARWKRWLPALGGIRLLDWISASASTIQRWYYVARRAADPVSVLRNQVRQYIGRFPSFSPERQRLCELWRPGATRRKPYWPPPCALFSKGERRGGASEAEREKDQGFSAPCKGTVFQWVRIPPAAFAPTEQLHKERGDWSLRCRESWKGLGEHAGRNVNERWAGLEKINAEADPAKLRGRLPPLEKRAKKAPRGSAGVVTMACMEEEDPLNTGNPSSGRAWRSTRLPRGTGRARWGDGGAGSTVEAG